MRSRKPAARTTRATDAMDTAGARPADYWQTQLERALLAPVRAMRREYLPLLMVYFAYGAMGLTRSPRPSGSRRT